MGHIFLKGCPIKENKAYRAIIKHLISQCANSVYKTKQNSLGP